MSIHDTDDRGKQQQKTEFDLDDRSETILDVKLMGSAIQLRPIERLKIGDIESALDALREREEPHLRVQCMGVD